ncbi:MAG TPA: hypothetical protein VFC05_10770 [Nitrososphaeraceae archaeon]|nr:hypothetical protein [Nitrososphaeraceae archaeon]
MHKSAMTHISLFLLMSTLIILVPFTSITFLNVKAQEYGAGSYDYDDDYTYSKYPTEENKYECRTGPFEGFFVSSVEFCKHIKFDDRKDDKRDGNSTGTQGPPALAGPQGPLGITFINSTNTYVRSANSSSSLQSGVFLTGSVVFCNPEDVVILRSLSVNDFTSDAVIIQDFENIPNGWQVLLKPITDFQPFTLQVKCFNNPPP